MKPRGWGGHHNSPEVMQTLDTDQQCTQQHQRLWIHDMATKIIYFTVNGRPEQAEFPVDCPAQDVKGRSTTTSLWLNFILFYFIQYLTVCASCPSALTCSISTCAAVRVNICCVCFMISFIELNICQTCPRLKVISRLMNKANHEAGTSDPFS